MKIINLKETDSTSVYLLNNTNMFADEDLTIAVSDYQTAGRGMGTNTWESEPNKNLLFSFLIHPTWLKPHMQYLISMVHALALYDVLSKYSTDFTIKWPNDIYWKDLKISGTRIDGNIKGGRMSDMVIGTGININQREFNGTAPNPVSLYQIIGRESQLNALLDRVIERFLHYYEIARKEWEEDEECYAIMDEYHKHLYRREGIYRYKDEDGEFEAELFEVHPNGIMVLKRTDGTLSQYEFKEVKFLI